ncbi:MAG: S8 family serine peptidase [Halieaceae bacterium]
MMSFLRPIKPLLVLLSGLLLAGCLHLQLGGPVTEASLTVAPLRDPAQVIQVLDTPGIGFIRDFFGAENWDASDDLVQLLFLGNVSVDQDLYQDEELYLVTASGGFDRDANTDLLLDADPASVTGQWHAILSGTQLRRATVSPLTEAAYRYLELNLDALSDSEVIEQLRLISQSMVPDLDSSGAVDYEDTLQWNRLINANAYLRDIAAVDELSEAVRASASATTLRSLSLEVVGQPGESSGPFTISGSITVTNATRVDSDVNDPFALYTDNSTIEKAQDLSNPVVLGGYVNLAGEGEEGGNFLFGDSADYYHVDLLASQRITMIMADDPLLNDLDLYLYDAVGNLLNASLGLSEFEQITVPADGEYFIAVEAFEGASNYQLTLGIGELPAQVELLRLSDDFVPGDIIARFRAHPGVDSMAKRARMTGMRVRGGLRRANLLQLEQGQDKRLQQRKLRTLRAMKRLRRREEVSSADLNYYVQATATPNDAFYSQQSWHYEMINLPAAWENSLGDDVLVAVVDTGVRLDHPDLAGQLVAGYDFIASPSIAGDGNGIDNNPEDPGDSEGSTPSSFHGTHVSGTIAAATNNAPGASSVGRGVAGVAWNARVMPLRALGVGGGTTYDVMQAVRYAAGLGNDSGTLPSQAADIINLSLAGGGYSSSGQALYSQVASLGIIVVAAAGNESTSQFAYPASYDDVISVSAVNINKGRASYSNFGSRIDVAAPGGDGFSGDVNGDGYADLILSTSADDSVFPIRASYSLQAGTSMAAPHVAGVAALMKSVYPDLGSDDFESLLQQGLLSDDLGSPGRDNTYGYGLINANKAVLVAQSLASGGSISEQPSITTSTSTMNFGAFADTLQLTLSNGGTGELLIDSIVAADSWVSVSAANVDAAGLGSYNISVQRSVLAIGSHLSSLQISSNGGDSTVQIILQQPDPNAVSTGNAGLHYILLLNADTGEVFDEISANVVEGQYDFSFNNIPNGRYQIVGGSDADNDFFICDAGEACGAWPVLDSQPAIIELNQDLSGLDFSSTFLTGIISANSSASSTSGGAGAETGLKLRRSAWRARTIKPPQRGSTIQP